MDRELFAPPLIFMVMQSETVKDTCWSRSKFGAFPFRSCGLCRGEFSLRGCSVCTDAGAGLLLETMLINHHDNSSYLLPHVLQTERNTSSINIYSTNISNLEVTMQICF